MKAKIEAKKPDEDVEEFMAMPAFKWVRCEDGEQGFIYYSQFTNLPYEAPRMKLQQAWRSNLKNIVWKDVEIEL